MKSFYSVLQVPIKPAAQEQLNIGLLLVDERSMHFTYSSKKLELVGKLLPVSAFALLKSYVIGLAANLNSDQNKIKEKFLNQDFISYLSKYNNNLITFSQPTFVKLEVNTDNFRKLFEKFVFKYQELETPSIESRHVSVKIQLKLSLYPKIQERVNINQEITTKNVPTLLIPSVKVDFIGANKKPVAGLGIDFEKSETVISNQVSKFVSLIKSLELDNRKSGQYYIVGKEPNRNKFKDQHTNWQHIKDSGLIEFVDVNEVDKVSEYIETHKVRPFIES